MALSWYENLKKDLADYHRLTPARVREFLSSEYAQPYQYHPDGESLSRALWSALLCNPVLPLLYLQDPALCLLVKRANRQMIEVAQDSGREALRKADETKEGFAERLAEEMADSTWSNLDGDSRDDEIEQYITSNRVFFELHEEDLDWLGEQWASCFGGTKHQGSYGVLGSKIAEKYKFSKLAKQFYRGIIDAACKRRESEEEY